MLRRQAWSDAFSHLSTADRQEGLDPADLVELAQAAQLIGKESESAELLARAHQGFLRRGDTQRAVRCAFWLGFVALLNGEVAQAGGWLSRAERLLAGESDCVERGYLLLPTGYRSVHGGDPALAYATFVQAAEIGTRFGDRDLATLALQGQGRALIREPGGDAAGRSNGRGHGRRGICSSCGRSVLQRDRGLRRNFRFAACAGVDVGVGEVVLVPTRHCPVPRAMHDTPR